MGDASSAVTGLITGALKILSFVGGVALIAVGLFKGMSWPMIWTGVGLIVVSQMIHALDQVLLDRDLKRWATAAVNGIGPVPPRHVRAELIRRANATRGIGGDVRTAFYGRCQEWSYDQRRSTE